jgi:hypothetical protein
MNYAVEINVWGKTTIYVESTNEEDAMDIALELIDYDDIQYEHEVINVHTESDDEIWE